MFDNISLVFIWRMDWREAKVEAGRLKGYLTRTLVRQHCTPLEWRKQKRAQNQVLERMLTMKLLYIVMRVANDLTILENW